MKLGFRLKGLCDMIFLIIDKTFGKEQLPC